jgi:hypothetical protein
MLAGAPLLAATSTARPPSMALADVAEETDDFTAPSDINWPSFDTENGDCGKWGLSLFCGGRPNRTH